MTDEDGFETVRADLEELARYAFERLRGRLVGLTDEEYLWEPAPGCWSVRPGPDGVYRQDGSESEPDPAPLTTIAWRICHLVDVISAEHNAAWLGLQPVRLPWAVDGGEPATAAAAIDRIGAAFQVFQGYLSIVDGATLADPLGPKARHYSDSTRMAFALHQLDELIHHSAEVAVLRDLYRATHAG